MGVPFSCDRTSVWRMEAGMKSEDFELHDGIIRLLKGMIKLYESWLIKKKERAA